MNPIKAIRDRLGLTQEAFGKGLNLSQASVSSYESGSTSPPPDVARKVIHLAALHGLVVTFDHVYGSSQFGQGNVASLEA